MSQAKAVSGRNRGIILGLVFTLLLFSGWGGAGAQPNVTVAVVVQPIEIFILSDFITDISKLGPELDTSTLPYVFTLTLTNNEPDSVQVKMKVELSTATYGQLAWGESALFWLKPHEVRSITNRDVSNVAEDYAVEKWGVEMEKAEELKSTILASGLVPTDTYYFNVTIYDAAGNLLDSKSGEVNVTNPTIIELISPGEPFTTEPEPIHTDLPLFQWFSTASRFNFKLVKIKGATSGEEAMQNTPVLELLDYGEQSYQYSSADEALENGEKYAWQVKGIVLTSGGPMELASEIWSFKVQTTTEGPPPPGQSLVLQALEELLGDTYSGYLSTLQAEGFSPTGVILLNLSPIDLTALQGLAQRFVNEELEITEVSVE